MRKLFISIVLLLSVSSVHAQTSIQVQSHKVVSIDEQFNVTFVIEGAKPTDFSWEPGADFDLATLKEAQAASARWIEEYGTSDRPEAKALRERIGELFQRAEGTMN